MNLQQLNSIFNKRVIVVNDFQRGELFVHNEFLTDLFEIGYFFLHLLIEFYGLMLDVFDAFEELADFGVEFADYFVVFPGELDLDFGLLFLLYFECFEFQQCY